MKTLLVVAAVIVAACGLLLIPIGAGMATEVQHSSRAPSMDLSAYSTSKPDQPLDLVFLHHSVGGMLLADRGPENPKNTSILVSHPNGGGLRRMLQDQGYRVHEASYGSAVADKTDLFDWLPKFRTQMDAILLTDKDDDRLAAGQRNRIVMFKSCYPNNGFEGEGSAPGNPNDPELTVWNAKATLSALLPEFQKQPNVLFVYVTAPPLSPSYPAERAIKVLAKKILGRPLAKESHLRSAQLARQFNNWVTDPAGWLRDYPLKNVVVFDFYDILTDHGVSNLARYPSGDDGSDSHPSAEGASKAAQAFVPFLNASVWRAGLSD